MGHLTEVMVCTRLIFHVRCYFGGLIDGLVNDDSGLIDDGINDGPIDGALKIEPVSDEFCNDSINEGVKREGFERKPSCYSLDLKNDLYCSFVFTCKNVRFASRTHLPV